VRLRAQEVAPGDPAALAGGLETGVLEQLPYRGGQRSSVVGVTTNDRQLVCGSSRLAAARKNRSAGRSSSRVT
jgi:hypothetical protein